MSATDREVMEINGTEAEDSLIERVSKLVENDTSIRVSQDYGGQPNTDASPANFVSPPGGARQAPTPGYHSSLNISSMSPLTKKPFTAFGNVHNLFTNQMTKVSISKFDKSPVKPHQHPGSASELDLKVRSSGDLGTLTPTSRARIDEARSLSPYGRERSSVDKDGREGRRSPSDRRITGEYR